MNRSLPSPTDVKTTEEGGGGIRLIHKIDQSLKQVVSWGLVRIFDSIVDFYLHCRPRDTSYISFYLTGPLLSFWNVDRQQGHAISFCLWVRSLSVPRKTQTLLFCCGGPSVRVPGSM